MWTTKLRRGETLRVTSADGATTTIRIRETSGGGVSVAVEPDPTHNLARDDAADTRPGMIRGLGALACSLMAAVVAVWGVAR